MTNGQKSVITKILTMACILIFLTTVINAAQHPFNNSLSIGGYTSAFEGPKASFHGVEATNANGYRIKVGTDYVMGGSGAPSSQVWGATMDFDVDAAEAGLCNIVGEETAVYIPQETLAGSVPNWVPASWLSTQTYITNPTNIYQINVTEPDGNVTCFYMEQWKLRYYCSFSAEWDGYVDAGGGVHGEVPAIANGELQRMYSNLVLWIELDTTPVWYIQGQGVAHFCIAEVKLAEDVQYAGTTGSSGGIFNNNPSKARDDTAGSVAPERQSSIVGLYPTPYTTVDDRTVLTMPQVFQGHELNPRYFRDHTFFPITFKKFGVFGGSNVPFTMLGWWVRGDVVTFCFDVTVFMIGQWNVKDIQQNPSDYGRFQRTSSATDFLSWLLSAGTLSWLLPIAIFVALLFFAPWVILALIAILRGGKK